jgi:hypothetical protein
LILEAGSFNVNQVQRSPSNTILGSQSELQLLQDGELPQFPSIHHSTGEATPKLLSDLTISVDGLLSA